MPGIDLEALSVDELRKLQSAVANELETMAEDQELLCATIFVDRVEYILGGQRRRKMVARHKCIARVSQQLRCEPDAVNLHVAVALLSAQWPDQCRKTMEFTVMTCASTLWGPIDTVMFGNYRCSLESLRGTPDRCSL